MAELHYSNACGVIIILAVLIVMGYVFPGSLKDFYYVTRRSFDDEIRRAWISLFLDTFLLAGFDRETCKTALTLDEPDFEDGLIRAAAEYERCTHIITRDVSAFTNASARGMSPEEYIASLQQG